MPSLCELPCDDPALGAITEDIPASHLFSTTH